MGVCGAAGDPLIGRSSRSERSGPARALVAPAAFAAATVAVATVVTGAGAADDAASEAFAPSRGDTKAADDGAEVDDAAGRLKPSGAPSLSASCIGGNDRPPPPPPPATPPPPPPAPPATPAGWGGGSGSFSSPPEVRRDDVGEV
jgi:hypothetical protein